MPTTNSNPPGSLATDLWPLTDAQLLEFRLNWIRDFAAVNCIHAVNILTAGSGYVDGEPLVFTNDVSDTTGTGAAGYVNVDETGAVIGVTMQNLGRLYTADPTITVTTAGGSGATFAVVRETVRLSGWNKSTSSTYLSDADIQERVRTIVIDRREELIRAYYDKFQTVLQDEQVPASSADSADYARYEQLQTLFRWLRADCREIMLNDPGFQGAVPDHARDKFFKQWNDSIATDKNWARQRSGGFGSLPRVIK